MLKVVFRVEDDLLVRFFVQDVQSLEHIERVIYSSSKVFLVFDSGLVSLKLLIYFWVWLGIKLWMES